MQLTGEHFAAFFNLSDETQTIHCDIETLHVGDEPCAHKDASLTELWSKEKHPYPAVPFLSHRQHTDVWYFV